MTAPFRRTLRVVYPLGSGRIVLRTADDWAADIEAKRVADDRQSWEFDLASESSALEYKPCLIDKNGFSWAIGANRLALLGGSGVQSVYPYFDERATAQITPTLVYDSSILGRELSLRVYLPAGRADNTLKRYPVLYMHDGRNAFFPEEAFLHQEWQVDETLERLTAMSVIDELIVVALYTPYRMEDYVSPGYERFSRAIVEELKPTVDANFPTLTGTADTAVLGSSLGGVAAFHLAWTYPEVFGQAACMSSTFWYENDLIERARSEALGPRKGLRLYLDSGWPNDNYEVTLSMVNTLIDRGFAPGVGVHHFAFPEGRHDESSWGARLHLPVQLFFGRFTRRAGS
jgi:predicted alpha/beta superfamily hydrolase